MRTVGKVLVCFAPADDLPGTAKEQRIAAKVCRRDIIRVLDGLLIKMAERNMLPCEIGAEELDIIRHKEMDSDITG
jgi:hypothetical protein